MYRTWNKHLFMVHTFSFARSSSNICWISSLQSSCREWKDSRGIWNMADCSMSSSLFRILPKQGRPCGLGHQHSTERERKVRMWCKARIPSRSTFLRSLAPTLIKRTCLNFSAEMVVLLGDMRVCGSTRGVKSRGQKVKVLPSQ